MDFIVWDEKYVTGVELVDQDHQVLVSLINKLHEAMLKGTARNDVESIISEMAEYTKFHFAREEELMATAGYAELATHKRLHDHFVMKTTQFLDDFRAGRIGLSVSIFTFLRDWLTAHILDIDQNMLAEIG